MFLAFSEVIFEQVCPQLITSNLFGRFFYLVTSEKVMHNLKFSLHKHRDHRSEIYKNEKTTSTFSSNSKTLIIDFCTEFEHFFGLPEDNVITKIGSNFSWFKYFMYFPYI